MQAASRKTKIPAVDGVSRPYRLYLKANIRLSVAKKRFSRVTAVTYTLW